MKHSLNQVAQTYQIKTGLINPPVILTRVASKEQVKNFINHKRPQILLFNLDKDLNVLNFGSLDHFITLCKNQFILALETEDIQISKTFVKKMNTLGIIDFFIISKDIELIKKSREVNGFLRSILKVEDVDSFIKSNNHFPFNIWIPSLNVDKPLIEKLQTKTLTVFTEAMTNIELKTAILSGINGIVTTEPLNIIKHYESFKSLTHIREVQFISHRGLHLGYEHSVGPENSLESAKHAYHSGANIIEIDIHLSSDHEVIVIHDEKTHRVSREKYYIAKTTYQQLKDVKLNKLNKHTKSRIYSLSEFLSHFKDENVRFLIETKPISKKLIKQTLKVIKDLNMEDRVSFISFSIKNISWQNDLSKFRSGYLFKPVKEDTLPFLLGLINNQNTTFNPFYKGLTKEIVTQFFHRAIPLWPWTVDAFDDLVETYHLGVNGITTNQFDTIKDEPLILSVETTTTFRGSPIVIKPTLTSLSGLEKHTKGKLYLIDDGGTGIEFKNMSITGALKSGTALFYMLVRLEFGKTTFYKTSPLIKVLVTL